MHKDFPAFFPEPLPTLPKKQKLTKQDGLQQAHYY